jgi:hypothetical protein
MHLERRDERSHAFEGVAAASPFESTVAPVYDDDIASRAPVRTAMESDVVYH